MIVGPWRSICHSLGGVGKEQTEKMKTFGDSLHCCSIGGDGDDALCPCFLHRVGDAETWRRIFGC